MHVTIHKICVCRCTLIDPRPQKVSKAQRKWLKAFAASQQHDIAAAQHPESIPLSATAETPLAKPDLASHAICASCLQLATTQLQGSTVAPSTIEALPAVTAVTELSCSASHHAMAQENVFAAEAYALPDIVLAQASASEPELPATTVQAQASASEAKGVTDTTQASAAEAEAPHQGQQGGIAHSHQSAPQDQACLLQQSDPQAAAQQRWPDLQGTLSHQLQVGHKLRLVTIHLESNYPAHCCRQCELVTVLYCPVFSK